MVWHADVLGVNDGSTVSGVCVHMCAFVCYTCFKHVHSYLWYWKKDFNIYINDIQGSATSPTAGNVTRFKEDVSSTTYPDGR